jgi:hypothetical protein
VLKVTAGNNLDTYRVRVQQLLAGFICGGWVWH